MQYKDVTPIIAELVRLKNSIPLEVDIGRRLPGVRKNTHGEAVRSGLKKALRVIEQAPAVTAMPRWIPVEERLPNKLVVMKYEYSDELLVYDGQNIRTAYYCHTTDVWHSAENEDETVLVTHWMPLPETPNGKPPIGGNGDDFVHGNHG